MPQFRNRFERGLRFFGGLGMLWAIALFPGTPEAAGFDCRQIRTVAEKIICENARLSALDEELNALYRVVRHADDVDQGALKTAQLEWLKLRDRCEDEECLARTYGARIRDLKERIAALRDGWSDSWTGIYHRTEDERFVRILHFPDGTLRFRFLDASEIAGESGEADAPGDLTGKVNMDHSTGVFRAFGCKLVFAFDEGKLYIIQDSEKGDCGFPDRTGTATGTYVRKRSGLAGLDGNASAFGDETRAENIAEADRSPE